MIQRYVFELSSTAARLRHGPPRCHHVMSTTVTLNSTPGTPTGLAILTRSQSRNSQRSQLDGKTSGGPSTRTPSLRAHPTSFSATRNASEIDISSISVHVVPEDSPRTLKPFDGIVDSEVQVAPPTAVNATRATKQMLRREQAYFVACCCTLFLAGWNECVSIRSVVHGYRLDKSAFGALSQCQCRPLTAPYAGVL